MNTQETIEKLSKMDENAIAEFRDELLSIIGKEPGVQDSHALMQFVKGYKNPQALQSAVEIGMKVNAVATEGLLGKYATVPAAVRSGAIKEVTLEERIKSLSRSVQDELLDELLQILAQNNVGIELTSIERSDIMQLVKGQRTPAAMFNAMQVALRAIEARKVAPAIKIEPKVRFGVELVPSTGLDRIVELAQRFENGGVRNIWVTDHYTNNDPYVTLTLIAKATNSATLGLGITNTYVRHVAATASAMSSLDKVSGGRMALGVGAGDKPTLASLNIDTSAPLARVKESVQVLRSLWRGDVVNFDGESVKLHNARLSLPPQREIPVYIGAQGPRMLRLAGEIGNGALINASHELDFRVAVDAIKDGALATNRSAKNVDVVAYTCFSVDEDEKAAVKAAVPVVAFIAAASPVNVLERHDLDAVRAQSMGEMIARGEMAKAFELVNSDFLDAFAIAGKPSTCIDRIDNLLKVGVTQFVFGSPIGPKKARAADLIAEKIIPAYA